MATCSTSSQITVQGNCHQKSLLPIPHHQRVPISVQKADFLLSYVSKLGLMVVPHAFCQPQPCRYPGSSHVHSDSGHFHIPILGVGAPISRSVPGNIFFAHSTESQYIAVCFMGLWFHALVASYSGSQVAKQTCSLTHRPPTPASALSASRQYSTVGI